MIGQIGYLGQVPPHLRVIPAILYTAGVTLGAALVGLSLGALGLGARWLLGLGYEPHPPIVLLMVGCAALAGGLRDVGLLRFRLPQPAKQVHRSWLAVFGPYRTGFLWGLAVGLAYTTMIQYSLYYVLAGWVVLTGQPLLGAQALAVYGLAHGVLLVLDVMATTINGGHPGGLLGDGRSRFFYPLGGAVLLGCGVYLIARVGLIQLATG